MIKKFSNKLVLTLLALMVGTVANAAVKLSIGQVSGATPGAVIEIPVYLDNDAAVATVGFDVRFPKGIVPISMEKNNERAKGTQGWTCNIMPTNLNPGAYRAGLMNFTKNISAGSGVIAVISASCSDIMETGDITLENVEVTLANGTVADVETEDGKVEISTVYPGIMQFSAPDYIINPGETFMVEVSLDNDIDLRSFQSKLQLPEGFELVEDEDEGEYIIGSDRNPEGTMYSYTEGAGIIGMLNMSGEPLEGESGVLFRFAVKAPEELAAESVITIKGFKGMVKGFTTSFGFDSDIALTVYNQKMLVVNIPGDIDQDGDVDADDLALFIQALAGGKLPTLDSEDFTRYDANQNGVINIADAQAIFNIFMYGSASGK